MKNVRNLLIVMITVLIAFSTNAIAAEKADDTLLEDIKTSSELFENALEVKNYKEAKEHLEVLFPLLKKELKLAKKHIQELKKTGESAQAKTEGKKLKRKGEINDKLHSIVEASSAALRVKADYVRSLVNEYNDLLEEQKQLVSSNG